MKSGATQEPTQDSIIHPILLYNVTFEYCLLYGALEVTMDMLRLPTNYRFIIIIIIINPKQNTVKYKIITSNTWRSN